MKIVLPYLLCAILIAASGCGSILDKCKGVIGRASLAENKARMEIDRTDNAAAKVADERLDKIGAISSGVDYALNKDVQKTPAATAAETLNERIVALANKPDFEEKKGYERLVDSLITGQEAGRAALNKKDGEIAGLSSSVKELREQKESALNKYKQLAGATAAKEDQYKATLGEMDRFLGLGAVWYGIKRFILRGMAWGIGLMVLFIVLRFASMSNPIAASIFAIFNQFGSWLINAIAMLFPKALSIAGHTATSVYNEYKSTMTKLVDSIQMAQAIASAAGREPTVKDVINEAEKSMDTREKAVIETLKKSLNWT